MKKKILSLITTFALTLVCLIIFSDNANASTIEDTNTIISTNKDENTNISKNAVIAGWEEYFRFESSWFSKSRFFIVQVHNVSFEGGEYMVRLYKPGTTTVIYERSGYVGPQSIVDHDFYVSSMSFSADAVWYRKSGSDAEILGMVYANW